VPSIPETKHLHQVGAKPIQSTCYRSFMPTSMEKHFESWKKHSRNMRDGPSHLGRNIKCPCLAARSLAHPYCGDEADDLLRPQ